MKLPRDLSGADLVRHLCRHYDYRQVNQEGSHVILETNVPRQHRLSVPNHANLRVGTLNAMVRAVAGVKGVDKDGILRGL
jgi:predicted RNA binding protein YcfA (HicA-like mRNA interferase family)